MKTKAECKKGTSLARWLRREEKTMAWLAKETMISYPTIHRIVNGNVYCREGTATLIFNVVREVRIADIRAGR